ncbi:hypothetical protein AK37_14273 [Rhodococcus pyridinivorans AK37]|uniref:DUF262 domain-containing protein n=2 Tax=Rhodococcus pyridinivorans TaxID=103816 RepID=H0JT43_9NOCA|nr:hypothetical protein AK37_14273 [Rhodococcus pyridinivorans AK37]
MQADTYQLKQVMTPERRYIIPTFQRDYEWTEEGQWRLLFEDLETVADRLAQARQDAEVTGKSVQKADKSVAPHFLGAIVCDQLPSSAGGLDLRAVIDGQQRLTTLQLLLRGVLDVLIEQNSVRAKQIRRLLENPSDVIDEPYERFKLWPRRKDREVWPIAMSDEPAPDGTHLYLKAREFFSKRARAAMVGEDGSDRTDAVVDALVGLFKLVVIDLEDNDDAQVIFEVLNGRQTPLSASDLVKNLLFLRGELADEKELEKLYDSYWAEFDEDWWKEKVGTGHAARGRRDVLLSAWLTAASGSEANVGHLYKEVRAYLDSSDRRTEEVLEELHRYGQAYKAVYGSSELVSKALAQSYRRLDILKIQTAAPLLLWLRTVSDSVLSATDHELAVAAIESWTVRRAIIGANTRGYGKAFVDVLKEAQRALEGGGSIADAIIAALQNGPNSLAWPSDIEVTNAFVSNKYYGSITQERIRLFLGAIDEYMQAVNPKTETASFEYDRLQVEHILPQRWRDHWAVEADDEAGRILAAQTRDAYVHRIGNLTLVSPTFNVSVSNRGWQVKRPEFVAQSKLQLNVDVAASETWDEESIDRRAHALASAAVQVWPSAETLTARM